MFRSAADRRAANRNRNHVRAITFARFDPTGEDFAAESAEFNFRKTISRLGREPRDDQGPFHLKEHERHDLAELYLQAQDTLAEMDEIEAAERQRQQDEADAKQEKWFDERMWGYDDEYDPQADNYDIDPGYKQRYEEEWMWQEKTASDTLHEQRMLEAAEDYLLWNEAA